MNLNRRDFLLAAAASAALPYLPAVKEKKPTVIKREVYSTGFPTLDAAIGGGLRRGEVTTWIGYPGSGRSVLMNTIYKNQTHAPTPFSKPTHDGSEDLLIVGDKITFRRDTEVFYPTYSPELLIPFQDSIAGTLHRKAIEEDVAVAFSYNLRRMYNHKTDGHKDYYDRTPPQFARTVWISNVIVKLSPWLEEAPGGVDSDGIGWTMRRHNLIVVKNRYGRNGTVIPIAFKFPTNLSPLFRKDEWFDLPHCFELENPDPEFYIDPDTLA